MFLLIEEGGLFVGKEGVVRNSISVEGTTHHVLYFPAGVTFVGVHHLVCVLWGIVLVFHHALLSFQNGFVGDVR